MCTAAKIDTSTPLGGFVMSGLKCHCFLLEACIGYRITNWAYSTKS